MANYHIAETSCIAHYSYTPALQWTSSRPARNVPLMITESLFINKKYHRSVCTTTTMCKQNFIPLGLIRVTAFVACTFTALLLRYERKHGEKEAEPWTSTHVSFTSQDHLSDLPNNNPVLCVLYFIKLYTVSMKPFVLHGATSCNKALGVTSKQYSKGGSICSELFYLLLLDMFGSAH